MKLSTAFSAAAAMMFAGSADAADLAQKWNISEDVSFEYESLSFELGYYVSDFIKNTDSSKPSMARINLFDDGCKDGGVAIYGNATSGIESIDLNDEAIDCFNSGDAGCNQGSEPGLLMDRLITVNITVDPETISANSLIYSEDSSGSQIQAEIRFCARFGLHTASVTSVEVNFLETLVTLNVDLTDGFEIGSIAVEPRDRLVRTANQVYLVVAYRCTDSLEPDTSVEPINQGTVVKVCVRPDDDALGDGIKMRSIDDFEWSRNTITQPAIVGPNKPAVNLLTDLTCVPGSIVCHFESILFAAFYTTAGAVLGSGVASLQFGTTNNGPNQRRGLRGEEEDRMLQEEPAAAAEFELDFDVAQAQPYGSSGAASFGVMASAVASFLIASLL